MRLVIVEIIKKNYFCDEIKQKYCKNATTVVYFHCITKLIKSCVLTWFCTDLPCSLIFRMSSAFESPCSDAKSQLYKRKKPWIRL